MEEALLLVLQRSLFSSVAFREALTVAPRHQWSWSLQLPADSRAAAQWSRAPSLPLGAVLFCLSEWLRWTSLGTHASRRVVKSEKYRSKLIEPYVEPYWKPQHSGCEKVGLAPRVKLGILKAGCPDKL